MLIQNLFTGSRHCSLILFAMVTVMGGCGMPPAHFQKENESLESKYDLPSVEELVPWQKARRCLESAEPAEVSHCLALSGHKKFDSLLTGFRDCKSARKTKFPEFEQALCLIQKRAIYFRDVRAITQADIDWCLQINEPQNCLQILRQMGISIHDVTTANLSDCQISEGKENIEKCLRRQGLIPDQIMTVEDEIICQYSQGKAGKEENEEKDFESGNSQIESLRTCLLNRQVIPESISENDLKLCDLLIKNGNFISYSQCLRQKELLGFVPINGKIISSCLRVAGEKNLDKCLFVSGFSRESVALKKTKLQQIRI